MIKNKNIEQLIKKYNENKLSHVFLIETDDKNLVLQDIKEFIKYISCPSRYSDNCSECNLCHLIDSDSLPTLSIIFPDGQVIKKSQMEELKMLFSHKPYFSKFNIYVINDADLFNSSSANTMLKFIEEPEDNTIGFLITNNKENVITTIKSRCEVLKAFYNLNICLNDNADLFNLAINYIYDIEIVKSKSIVMNKKIMDQKLEKSQIIKFFQIVLSFYLDLLKEKVPIESLIKLKNITEDNLIKRIKLINDILDKLNYNVNISLLLDYFVLSLEDLM